MATLADAVRIPQTGLMAEGGTLVRWRKQEGEAVAAGEPLFDLETAKAVVEVEAEASGLLRGLRAAEGDDVAVGQVVAWLAASLDERLPDEPPQAAEPESPGAPGAVGSPGAPAGDGVALQAPAAPGAAAAAPAAPGAAAAAAATGPGPAAERAPDSAAAPPAQPAVAAPSDGLTAAGAPRRVPASPLARRLATEAGLDWRSLAGSGPGGRVESRDVQAAIAMRQAEPAPVRDAVSAVPSAVAGPAGLAAAGPARDQSRVRRAVASRMERSVAIPQFASVRRLDASLLQSSLRVWAGRSPVPLTYTDFLLQASLAALQRVPRLHAHWGGDGPVAFGAPAVGLAVATDAGLLLPVLRCPFDAPLLDLAGLRSALVERARRGRLTMEDTGDPTFVLSNLGPLGVDHFQALLDPGAAAALAVGAVRPEPVVRDGAVAVVPRFEASLTVDHRVGDGADAAAFLAALAAYCEAGEGMRFI